MKQRQYRICVLPGDGIGPEVVAQAWAVLLKTAELEGFGVEADEQLIGGAAYEACGEMLPASTLAACQASDAVLLGAVGGPRWDKLADGQRPEQALLGLREALGLYANLRPARLYAALAEACPLRPEKVEGGMDMLIVRELTGGIYFGERGRRKRDGVVEAFDTECYSTTEIERIARLAFECAAGRRGRLCSVDKANVLESSRLWRETVVRLAAEYPGVQLEQLYVDNASMQLIRRPSDFDVLLCSNLFGDILSDEAAEITGSIGLLPSASLGKSGTPGLFEPIHGSAPDLAGKDLANPLATILSLALLCRLALGEMGAAARIEQAVEQTLEAGLRSADLLGPKADGAVALGCRALGAAVLERLL